MKETYSVREFIRLTPPQKQRLQQRDPEQYKKLLDATNKMFPKETDQEAAKELARK